jgi:hypothetical protein
MSPARERFAPKRSAAMRSARERLAPERSAPERRAWERGAHIVAGLGVALLGGLVVSALVALLRRSRFLWPALLLGAAILAYAIALVAVDSATYVQDKATCGFLSPSETGTSTGHFAFLYVAWGMPLVLLLLSAASAFGRAETSGVESDESVPTPSLPTGSRQ